MNWMLLAVAAVLIGSMALGARKGLLRQALTLFGALICLWLVSLLLPYTQEFIRDHSGIEQSVSDRVDRMTDMEILPHKRRAFNTLIGSDGNQLDLNAYMEKHIYMFAGENIRAVFRAEKFILSDIIDMFGKDVKFSDESDQQITVTADVNEQAMEQFAKTYSPWIEIISPASLREKMIQNLRAGLEKYQKQEG